MTAAAWITLAITWTVIGVITVRLFLMVLRRGSADRRAEAHASAEAGAREEAGEQGSDR